MHERIFTFDIIKAIATAGIVVINVFLHQWQGNEKARFFPPDEVPIDIQVIFYILTQGGLFFVISGALVSYSFINNVKKKKYPLKTLFISEMAKGAFILVLHIFFIVLVIFVLHPEEALYIEYFNVKGFWKKLWFCFYHNDVLHGLGMNGVVLPCVYYFLYAKPEKLKRNLLIFFTLGCVILFITPFINSNLIVRLLDNLENGNYFFALVNNMFCSNWFPFLPHISHGFFGSMVGVVLAHFPKGKSLKKMFKLFILLGVSLFAIGSFLIFWNFGALYTGLYEYPSSQGMFFRTYLQTSHIGVFMLLFYFGVVYVDNNAAIRRFVMSKFYWFYRLSFLSLTVFTCERWMKLAVKVLVFDVLWEGWDIELWSTAVYGLFNLFVWVMLAKVWEKYNWVFSLEWFLLKIMEKYSGKKSRRFMLDSDEEEKERLDKKIEVQL